MLALLFVPLSTRDDPIGSSNRAIKASNAPLHFFLNVGRDFRLDLRTVLRLLAISTFSLLLSIFLLPVPPS